MVNYDHHGYLTSKDRISTSYLHNHYASTQRPALEDSSDLRLVKNFMFMLLTFPVSPPSAQSVALALQRKSLCLSTLNLPTNLPLSHIVVTGNPDHGGEQAQHSHNAI